MTARTVVTSNLGTTLAISASLPATYDASGYGSTSITYTEVGEIENHGSHGVTAQVPTFTPCDTGVVAKMKGSLDYGTKSMTIGYLPGNAGQVILKAASISTAHYSIKITYDDGEVQYLDAIVSKHEQQDGEVNGVRRVNVDLAISRAPVVVLP